MLLIPLELHVPLQAENNENLVENLKMSPDFWQCPWPPVNNPGMSFILGFRGPQCRLTMQALIPCLARGCLLLWCTTSCWKFLIVNLEALQLELLEPWPAFSSRLYLSWSHDRLQRNSPDSFETAVLMELLWLPYLQRTLSLISNSLILDFDPKHERFYSLPSKIIYM